MEPNACKANSVKLRINYECIITIYYFMNEHLGLASDITDTQLQYKLQC